MSLAIVLAGAAGVAAQQPPADRCTGTLCDFYYGSSASDGDAKKPAASPTPVTVPSSGILGFFASPAPAASGSNGAPAPVATPRVSVQGGGLVGKLNGAPEERCTGTLCDFFYGGPPPEKPEPQPASLAPAEAHQRGLAPAETRTALAPAEAPDDAPSYAPITAHERREAASDAKPRCVAPASDPWRCYR